MASVFTCEKYQTQYLLHSQVSKQLAEGLKVTKMFGENMTNHSLSFDCPRPSKTCTKNQYEQHLANNNIDK